MGLLIDLGDAESHFTMWIGTEVTSAVCMVGAIMVEKLGLCATCNDYFCISTSSTVVQAGCSKNAVVMTLRLSRSHLAVLPADPAIHKLTVKIVLA